MRCAIVTQPNKQTLKCISTAYESISHIRSISDVQSLRPNDGWRLVNDWPLLGYYMLRDESRRAPVKSLHFITEMVLFWNRIKLLNPNSLERWKYFLLLWIGISTKQREKHLHYWNFVSSTTTHSHCKCKAMIEPNKSAVIIAMKRLCWQELEVGNGQWARLAASTWKGSADLSGRRCPNAPFGPPQPPIASNGLRIRTYCFDGRDLMPWIVV